jgi:hypothetical protein
LRGVDGLPIGPKVPRPSLSGKNHRLLIQRPKKRKMYREILFFFAKCPCKTGEDRPGTSTSILFPYFYILAKVATSFTVIAPLAETVEDRHNLLQRD